MVWQGVVFGKRVCLRPLYAGLESGYGFEGLALVLELELKLESGLDLSCLYSV